MNSKYKGRGQGAIGCFYVKGEYSFVHANVDHVAGWEHNMIWYDMIWYVHIYLYTYTFIYDISHVYTVYIYILYFHTWYTPIFAERTHHLDSCVTFWDIKSHQKKSPSTCDLSWKLEPTIRLPLRGPSCTFSGGRHTHGPNFQGENYGCMVPKRQQRRVQNDTVWVKGHSSQDFLWQRAQQWHILHAAGKMQNAS